jgi:hypothetical protein
LCFLEKIQRVKNKEDAIISAIRIFKKLNMQDWFPTFYRIGQERVIITPTGIIQDLVSTLDEKTLYNTSKKIAINRKSLNFFDTELDLFEYNNWGIVLNEMEHFGWGHYKLIDSTIQVKHPALPQSFIKGYLETLFNIKFQVEQISEGHFNLIIDRHACA